jgi:hypothetical protein
MRQLGISADTSIVGTSDIEVPPLAVQDNDDERLELIT